AVLLLDDGAAGFGFPLPHFLQEFLPAQADTRHLPLGKLALDDQLGGDAGMVGAGCHSTSLPRMRSKRARMSCKVLLRAWPICNRPVTLGGGITMEKGSACGRLPQRKAPEASHTAAM